MLLDARAHKESAQQTLLHLIDEEQGKLKREQKNQAAVKQLLSKLQGLDAEQQRGSFGAQKGLLRWPLKGQLLNRFGALKSATANSKWDGVAIQATRGNEIRAIYSGIVVFADWFQGYGWMMIIDHGSDYMSLYAHAEGLNKNQGEQVQKGEVIALVGDSGSADKPHLYFEIRRQGAPVNPADWCKAPKLAYSAD